MMARIISRPLLHRISFLTRIAAYLLVFAAGLGEAGGAGDDLRIKAAFIFHFYQFVEWPQDVPAEMVLGVIGNDDLRDMLMQLIREKGEEKLVLRVEGFATIEDAIGYAHMIVVGESEAENIGRIIEAVAGRPILTVGEVDGFAGAGGIIGFVRRGTRQKFEVNQAAAERAGLRLSSQLLQAAILID